MHPTNGHCIVRVTDDYGTGRQAWEMGGARQWADRWGGSWLEQQRVGLDAFCSPLLALFSTTLCAVRFQTILDTPLIPAIALVFFAAALFHSFAPKLESIGKLRTCVGKEEEDIEGVCGSNSSYSEISEYALLGGLSLNNPVVLLLHSFRNSHSCGLPLGGQR